MIKDRVYIIVGVLKKFRKEGKEMSNVDYAWLGLWLIVVMIYVKYFFILEFMFEILSLDDMIF